MKETLVYAKINYKEKKAVWQKLTCGFAITFL